MGRMSRELMDRAESLGDRFLNLARALERKRVWNRVIDQIVGCGTSVGANVFEADEAMSRKDWIKSMGIAVKELNEARYWLRRIEHQQWIASERIASLAADCDELRRIFGAMIASARGERKRKPS